MSTKRYILLFLYVSVTCVFTGTAVLADTVIPYSIAEWTPPITVHNGWTYIEEIPGTLELTANPSGGIIASINLPTGTDDGGLVASRHDLPDYSVHNRGFIQLEYSSLSSVITGNPEGLSLCLEIEFSDADYVFYEMAIAVSQDAEESIFETWFESVEGDFYYETPVPDGLSLAEGALGLYSNGSIVLPYFIDADGFVLYPFAAWDVSGITGTHDYRVDNDFEGTTTTGGTVIASVNLEQVVYGPGSPGTIEPLSGLVWFPDVPDIGYSLDEVDWLYFYSYEPVLAYNFTTGQWLEPEFAGLFYVGWPFMYEIAAGSLWFLLPPESGLFVYHFSTNQWTVSPRIIPW